MKGLLDKWFGRIRELCSNTANSCSVHSVEKKKLKKQLNTWKLQTYIHTFMMTHHFHLISCGDVVIIQPLWDLVYYGEHYCGWCNGVCVCVCVCVCVFSQRSSIGDIRGLSRQLGIHFTPGICPFVQSGITMQNALSLDPRGTLVVYNAPARFTY